MRVMSMSAVFLGHLPTPWGIDRFPLVPGHLCAGDKMAEGNENARHKERLDWKDLGDRDLRLTENNRRPCLNFLFFGLPRLSPSAERKFGLELKSPVARRSGVSQFSSFLTCLLTPIDLLHTTLASQSEDEQVYARTSRSKHCGSI